MWSSRISSRTLASTTTAVGAAVARLVSGGPPSAVCDRLASRWRNVRALA